MKNEINKLDGTRPITEALLLWDTKNNAVLNDISLADKVAKSTDVIGVNYTVENWEKLHKAYPDKPFIVTESAAFPSTGGCTETESGKCGAADFFSQETVKSVSASCRMNEKYLGHLFKKNMELNFCEYKKLRLKEAAQNCVAEPQIYGDRGGETA